jgi:hypothetical protein
VVAVGAALPLRSQASESLVVVRWSGLELARLWGLLSVSAWLWASAWGRLPSVSGLRLDR